MRLGADLFILAGVSAVLVSIWMWADAAVYQKAQRAAFESAAPSPRLPGKPAEAEPSFVDPLIIGEIDIPKLNVAVMVREGVDANTLRRAIGHLPGTAWPGQTGNLVLLGHRDTFFRPLRRIARNDQIHLRTRNASYIYVVDSIAVVPADRVGLTTSNTPRMTLITCFPFDFIGPAPGRYVVTAALAAPETTDISLDARAAENLQ